MICPDSQFTGHMEFNSISEAKEEMLYIREHPYESDSPDPRQCKKVNPRIESEGAK